MIKVKTANNILAKIETLVVEHKISYIDAMIHYCDKNDLEPEVLGELIKGSSVFKGKVQQEAEILNFLPKTKKLPI